MRGLRHLSSGFVSNVTPSIEEKIGQGLLLQRGHPINTLKMRIQSYFGDRYSVFDSLSPHVTTQQCFDDLLVPRDHVSRSPSDTFYVNPEVCLRPHTSAHQTEFLRRGETNFIVFGDCYRRDEIDASHYPVFHQVEGVRVWKQADAGSSAEQRTAFVIEDLKHTLEGLAKEVFQSEIVLRWNEDYFPFTHPSLELEVAHEGDWLELLGCGVIRPEILENCGLQNHVGWAFGAGLERLAMRLFNIPDIRLFWSQDPRFLEQFKPDEVTKFEPYSKYPPCLKDMSFWTPESFEVNDFYAAVREVAGDLVEKVDLIDQFQHPKTLRHSHCYRITYRSMDRNLVNSEVDQLQEEVRESCSSKLGIELR